MESSDSIASIKVQRAVADSPKTLKPRSTISRADTIIQLLEDS